MEGIIQKQTAMQKAPQQKQMSVTALVNSMLDKDGMRKRFDELLGKRTPQFVSSIVSMVNADKNLQQAFYESPMTVIQASLKAAMFDLPIDQSLGYAYIVPFLVSTVGGSIIAGVVLIAREKNSTLKKMQASVAR